MLDSQILWQMVLAAGAIILVTELAVAPFSLLKRSAKNKAEQEAQMNLQESFAK